MDSPPVPRVRAGDQVGIRCMTVRHKLTIASSEITTLDHESGDAGTNTYCGQRLDQIDAAKMGATF